MKCEDFRASVQSALDASVNVALSAEQLGHAEACESCKSYYESTLELHRALQQIPRVSPSVALVASLNRINQLDFVPMKLSWSPEIRLAIEMLIPVTLPYIAQVLSLDQIQHALEVLMLSLGLALFGVAVLKPRFLGKPQNRPALKES